MTQLPTLERERPAPSSETPRLRQWQKLTIALMVVGYAGYYLCRSDLSIATPLIIKEFGPQGVNKVFIGAIASVGTLAYACGKFLNGSAADFLGGKRLFLMGMGGAVLFTLLFGIGGLPLFTLAWFMNRLVQSMGWVGMVRITSRWFSFSTYGAAMGLISLSYLFGDFFSRQFLSKLIDWGVGWRGLFVTAAATLGVIFIANLLLLKESPKDIGEAEPAANPENLFGEEGQEVKQTGLRDLLIPLFRSPVFWVVCALSFGFTLVRETFNNWTPDYLTEVAKMSTADAGRVSSYFPLFGGISVLLCGFLSDRLGRTGRAAIIFFGLVLSIPALIAFGYAHFGSSTLLPILALGAVAVATLGPYSFLAGAVALDFGGKRGSATACGWIDGIGYIGGILAGEKVGSIAQNQGWRAAFLMLAGVTAISSIAAAIYWVQQARASSPQPRLETASGPAFAVVGQPAESNSRVSQHDDQS